MLGLPLFHTYIHDISDGFASLPLIYTNDANLFEIVEELVVHVQGGGLNFDLNVISEWADNGW